MIHWIKALILLSTLRRTQAFINTEVKNELNCGIKNKRIVSDYQLKIKKRVYGHVASRIINGYEVGVNEYPWMASIVFFKPSNPKTAHIEPQCGGALINKQWVVTAAHCFYSKQVKKKYILPEPEEVFVTLGEHDRSDTSESGVLKTEAAEYKINDYYVPNTTVYFDIAMVRLKTVVDWKKYPNSIGPICLPTEASNYASEKVKAIGWGLTEKTEKMNSPVLLGIDIMVYNSTFCAYHYNDASTNRMFKEELLMCAASEEFGRNEDEAELKDTCQNDSGGPIMAKNTKGRLEMVGVVNAGVGELHDNCGNVGIYQRVSYHTTWINSVMNFHYSLIVATAVCPEGYTFKDGDIPDHRGISSLSAKTASECGNKCDREPTCKSFVYSNSLKLCILRKESKPTTSKYQDFQFCAKNLDSKTAADYSLQSEDIGRNVKRRKPQELPNGPKNEKTKIALKNKKASKTKYKYENMFVIKSSNKKAYLLQLV